MDTPRELLIACKDGDTQRVAYLLELGVNPDSSDFWNGGQTPLMNAVMWNRLDVAKVLIEYGADLDLMDMHGYTALMTCIFVVDFDIPNVSTIDISEMSKLLLTSGCDAYVVAPYGHTFLNMLPHDARIEMEEFIAGLVPKPAKNDEENH